MPRRPLILERLEDRILLNAATPVAGIDLPAEEFINEGFDFAVSFDNTAAPGPDSTGFAPYVDIVIPAEIDTTSLSISFLGASVSPLAVATFDGAQWLDADSNPLTEHPLTGLALDGGDALTASAVTGDQLFVVQLPFGSFTADQPVARLEFSGVDLGGTVGTPNTLAARGGFAFGCDEFDNPTTDAPLLQAPVTANITPTVIELTKTLDGDENESATGPNYPLTYTLEVDIATGQTVTDLNLRDVLPANVAYIDALGFVAGGTPTVVSSPVVDTDAPDLLLAYGDVVGVAGTDIVVTYQFYIPDVIADNDGNDNDDGAAVNPFVNAAEVTGNYLGNPVSDSDAFTLTGKLIAVQKGVSLSNDVEGNGATPGDTLTYTLNFQVSDFTSFSAITLTDTVGNGLEVDSGFVPVFSFNENGVNTAGSFTLTSALNNPFTGNVVQTDLGGGVTQLVFDVSQELIDRGQDGILAGDALSPATTGTITFRARILEDYTAPAPGPDLSIDIDDTLTNSVVVTGTTAGGDVESDTSAAAVTISGVTLDKSIFAVDGNTAFNAADGLFPGQDVTYRIRVELPTADVENLVLSDFLPLPVFDATALTTFDNTFPPPGGVPPSGTAVYGPDHNLNAQTFLGGAPNDPPTITTNANSNTIAFTFGTFDAAPPTSTVVVDVLFTVTLLDKPFGDGLFLINQSVSQFGNTGGTTVSNTEIVQIVLNEPALTLTKGAVASDNPNAMFDVAVGPVTFNAPGASDPFSGVIDSGGLTASPVDANVVDGIDAGDTVTFALVVENTGGAGAFDILLRDTLPGGFTIPAGGLNLQVRSGDAAATPIGFTSVGAGLFSATPGEGIRIDDDADGVLAGRDGAAGSNVLIVTYELQAAANIEPTTVHENGAILEAFAAREGGTDFTDGFDKPEYEDTATVKTVAPSISKSLLATDRAFTDGDEVAIGEIVTFELLVTLPEGEIADLVVTDLLPAGMIFAGGAQLLTTVAGSPALTADFAGTVNLVSAVSTGGDGDDIVFTLDDGAAGNVIVNDDNDATNNSFVLRFDATVADVPGNDGIPPGQTTLANTARIDYTDADGATDDGTPGAATPLVSNTVATTVVEPLLDIAKAIDLDSVDAGDIVTVTLTLRNNGTADAFDIEIEDIVDPVKFTNVVAGAAPVGFINNSAGNIIRYNANPGFALAEGAAPVVFTFTAEVTGNIVPGEIITNTATINTASTLPAGGRDVSGDTGTDTAQVELGLDKTIVATSEAHTGNAGGEQVAIGEIVRYRLVVELPEAAALDLTLQDLLPDGLTFIDPQASGDDNVRIAFVSDGGLSSAGAIGIGDPGAFVIGDETTIDTITPTFALADANISSTADSDVDTYVSGTDVFFRLGDVTNADSDDNKEFIVIEFNALVNNEAGNTAGTDLTNSYRALSDDNGANTQIGSDSDPVSVTIAEPAITVDKQITTAGTDAGDTVVYDIVITNAAGPDVTSAFDIRVVDDLDALDPGTLTLNSAVFNAGSTGAALSNDATFGSFIDMTIDQLDAGESVTITVTATIAADIDAGRSIDNAADMSATSLPGPGGTLANPTGSTTPGASGGSDGERDGSGGINDLAGSSQIGFTTPVPEVDKRLVDEGSTNVGIGDVVQYDIVVTVPEGHTENLRIADAIPDGLAVAQAELITLATGSAYLSTDFAGTVQNAANVAAVTAQDNGVDLAIDLGDVDVTATSGTSGNQFVIRVTTVVLNDPATSGLNGSQTVLTNAASLTYTDPDDGPGNTPLDVVVDDPTDPALTVTEPELTIDKQVVVGGAGTSGDAGDSAVWTIVIAHSAASTATAFDLDLNDTLPATFTPSGFTATRALAGDATALFDLTGNILSTVGDIDLALGQTLTLTITGTLNDSLAPGATVTNTANLDYSSGDSDVSDLLGGAAGPNDAQDDERSRSINDDASLSAPRPTFEKVIIGSDEAGTDDGLGEVTIGETITYGIVFSLPEGTYTELVISDDVPTGMDFVDGSATIVPPAGYNGTLPTITAVGGLGSGDDIVLTLSTPFTVVGDNDTNNNRFTLQYQAVVLEAGNSGLAGAQTALGNTAGVTLDDPDNPGTPLDLEVTGQPGVTSDGIELTVVEPRLTINKTSVVARADAGDVVTYTLTISHTAQSTGPAFDLVITDQLLGVGGAGDKLDLVDDPAVSTSAGTVVIGGAAPGDQEIRIEVDEFGRDDAPIVVTYSALLNGNVNAVGDSVTNTASLAYDSHGGSPAEQRVATPVDDTHTVDVPLTTPEFDKSVIATSLAHTGNGRLDPGLADLVVGEVVTYRLVATFNEGSYAAATDATVSDQLPDYLGLVGTPRIVTGGTDGVGMNVDLAGSTVTLLDNVNGDGENDFFQIDFDLNTVAVDPLNPALIHDQIYIEFDARVLDVDDGLTNLNGNVLTNTATLVFDPAGAAVVSMASADVEIVEPELEVTKTASDPTPNLGDTITYTLVVAHAPGAALPGGSGITAYDIEIEDLLAPELSLVVGSVAVSEAPAGFPATGLAIVSGNGAGDSAVRVTLDSLELFTAPEGQLTITYEAVVTGNTANFGNLVTNTATASFDGIPGDDPNQRMESVSGAETVRIVGPDLDVSKTDSVATTTPGSAITYTITVNNKAAPLGDPANADDASNILVVDTLPAGVSFVASPDAEFTGFNATTRELTWLVPALAAGNSINLTVNATVDDPAPAGAETLENTVSVSSDDFDPTPADNTATDSTALDAAPDLSITKNDGVASARPGDRLTYTLVVSNNGNQGSSGVVVTDRFEPGTYGPITASQPAGVTSVVVDGVGGTITWTIAELAGGESITLTVNTTLAQPLAAGVTDFTNTAGVVDDGSSGPDANPGDETATDTNTVVGAAPDYVVTKSNATDTLRPNETVTWVIEVRNVGNQGGTGVVVVDSYDNALLENVTASDGGVIDARAGTVTWNLASLAGGEARSFTLTGTVVQVPPAGQLTQTNNVAVSDDGSNGADPTPANNLASDTDALQVFVYDGLRNEAMGVRSPLDDFFARDHDETRWLEPLPVDALFTGHAEPHTTLVITLIDQQGASIAQQVVVTDTGGNWVANFGGTVLTSQPHAISITQQTASENASTPGGFNLRTYFSPALQGQLFFVYQPSVETVSANQAGATLEAMAGVNRDPLAVGWEDAPSYEFFASSSTTTQYVN